MDRRRLAAARSARTLQREELAPLLRERLEHELYLRRSFEAALLRAKTQAEEATASRTRFLAAASHDLRQPLQSITTHADILGIRNSQPEIAGNIDALEWLTRYIIPFFKLDPNIN